MPKMAHASEDHRDAGAVCCLDDFRITHRAAGLNNGSNTSARRNLNAIGEGEEGVASEHSTFGAFASALTR